MNFSEISSQLSQKDQNNFKQLIKYYDSKQYKKGIKMCEKILEITICFKGLFQSLLDEMDEGLKSCKQGLMKNLKSSLCWNIYGMVHRNNSNYIESTKCYTQALKLDKSNLQIQRDLCLLQIQIRDLHGHHDSRFQALQNNPKLNNNWVAFAIANHLIGDLDEARKVLNSFYKVLEDNDDLKKSEKSELYLYEAQIILEQKQYNVLEKFLVTNQNKIIDKLELYEYQLKAFENQNKQDEIICVLNKLIQYNSENHQYINDLYKYTKPSDTYQFFQQLKKQYPQSQSIQLIELQYLNGDQFEIAFTNYIKSFFIHQKPSLFNQIKHLYKDEKVQQIENVFKQQEQSIYKNQTFYNDNEKQNQCCLLWSYMLLSQHYDYNKNYDLAMEYINKSIDHTQSLVELYLIKAKIYKHLNQLDKAQIIADQARQMDLNDRYLNNKAIKYALLNNDTQKGQQLMSLFIKYEVQQNPYELQTNWYEQKMGEAYLRQKKYGYALRQFKFIDKQFDDIQDDQYDFHVYCMRKYTLRQYVNLIKYQDNLASQKLFIVSYTSFINALLEYNQFQKQQDKIEELQQQIKELQVIIQNDVDQKLDINGLNYLKNMKCPLQEALLIVKKIQKANIQCPKQAIKTYQAIFQVFILTGNFKDAIIYLNKIKEIENNSQALQQIKQSINDLLKEGKNTQQLQEMLNIQ